MTRFLRAVILPLVLLSLTALNSFGDPVRYPVPLACRKYLTATGGADFHSIGTTGTAGFVDSVTFSINVTSASTAAQQCTTSTFSLDGLAPVRTIPGLTSGAGADSICAFYLYVGGDNHSSTTAFDTLTATLQGSFDNGANWMAAPAVRVVEPTGGNGISKGWTIPLIQAVPAGAPTNANMASAPLLRLILGGGGSYGGTDSGQFTAQAWYWRDPLTIPFGALRPRP